LFAEKSRRKLIVIRYPLNGRNAIILATINSLIDSSLTEIKKPTPEWKWVCSERNSLTYESAVGEGIEPPRSG
jgi:hypothetical protein